MIREFWPIDLPRLQTIHYRYYRGEFEFPDFLDHYLNLFTIIKDEEIILCGGIKTIIEAVALTDKSKSVRVRRNALLELLTALKKASISSDYNQIHTTVIDDPVWEAHLKDVGFKEVRGKVLVLNI